MSDFSTHVLCGGLIVDAECLDCGVPPIAHADCGGSISFDPDHLVAWCDDCLVEFDLSHGEGDRRLLGPLIPPELRRSGTHTTPVGPEGFEPAWAEGSFSAAFTIERGAQPPAGEGTTWHR